MKRLEKYFRLHESGSTVSREVLGGTTTFLALSYIIFVQPGLLSQAGMDFHAVLYATCLASALATFLMGVVANYPVARERLAKVALLRQLLFPQAAVKYEGHTDLVGSAEYNLWLSEQRALQVYTYQTQQQIELMEEARREFAAQQVGAANQLLIMDFPTSRREPTKRSLLLASLADVVERKSFREPEIPAKGPQEKNRRVVLLFPETDAGQLTLACEQPAESALPQS